MYLEWKELERVTLKFDETFSHLTSTAGLVLTGVGITESADFKKAVKLLYQT